MCPRSPPHGSTMCACAVVCACVPQYQPTYQHPISQSAIRQTSKTHQRLACGHRSEIRGRFAIFSPPALAPLLGRPGRPAVPPATLNHASHQRCYQSCSRSGAPSKPRYPDVRGLRASAVVAAGMVTPMWARRTQALPQAAGCPPGLGRAHQDGTTGRYDRH